jgi:penicillin-binding protein 1C
MRWKRLKTGYRVLVIAVWIVACFGLLDALFPATPRVGYAPVVLAADSTVLHTFLSADGQWRFKARLDEITPKLKQAIIFKEDKYFYYHPGINLFAIVRAVAYNVFTGRRTSGASTITMQVARLSQPKKRTYWNKCVEMFRALQLEVHYSKDEILQLYLNMVPYGSNIQGVKAAAILYFDKLPVRLSLAEIATLSVVPNRPNSLCVGTHDAAIVAERNKWLLRYQRARLFSSQEIQDALSEPLTGYRHKAPAVAPQLAHRLRSQHPTATEIYTTINTTIQDQAQEIAAAYTRALKVSGINNLAVIVIENATRKVSAYVGSSDFADKENHGEVDGVAAVRSPGSALKPLLYGLCMDMGIITPKTIIADVPINIDGYVPENYDLQFRGNVAAEDALKNSLNIPAVRLLQQAGVSTFVAKMTATGFQSIAKRKDKLGYSLILGGCGVKLEELAGMYATIANGGNYQPLQLIADSAKKRLKPVTCLSPEAAYLITSILRELHRPDLPNMADQAVEVPNISWKTGTSYGRKDAWSVGFDDKYTIGVWAGNFDGKGVAALNGAGTATPLLFRLFNALHRRSGNALLRAPQGLGERLVCKQSGLTPEETCTDQVMDYYLPGISSNRRCTHQVPVWTTPDESIAYCTACLPTAGYKTVLYSNIPADLQAYYEQYHIIYQKLPLHNPACTRVFDGKAPTITSLTNSLSYVVVDKGTETLQLACSASNDVKTVYWYINNAYFATSSPTEKKLFVPTTPTVKISCVDDKGRTTKIAIKVKFL